MSTKGYSVLQNLSYNLGPRTVQITVSPRPTSFAERRAVLHALQKYAQVQVFRKLEDHNSSFISVLTDKSAVKELVDMSPLYYQLATTQPNGSVKNFLTSATSTDPIINPDRPTSWTEVQETRTDGEPHRDFTVHIFPAEGYIHTAAIRKSPLHGPWPEPRQETLKTAMLKDILPDDIMAEGLSDWETGGQIPISARSQLLEDLLLGTKSGRVSNRAIMDRIQRRQQREKVPSIMEGLLHLQQHQGKK